MKVVLKPSAIRQFKTVPLKAEEGIRIEAIFVGSCSLYVDHLLLIDDKQVNDDLYHINDIQILISKESQKHLPDIIYVDYNANLGYKMYSDEETYRYNLELISRKK